MAAIYSSIRPTDYVRNGAIESHATYFHELYYKIRDCFWLGQTDSFHPFYEEIKPLIVELRNCTDLEKLKNLLQLVAKVEVSIWGRELRSQMNPELAALRTELGELQVIAQPHLAGRDLQLVRWIQSNAEQQRFAAQMNSQIVPYRYEEIPAGSILLTNPDSFLASLESRNKPYSFWYKTLLVIKNWVARLFTGNVYTHAELVLTNGAVFDLFKKPGTLLSGEGSVKERRGQVCYRDIIVPKQGKMMSVYKGAASTFLEVVEDIEKEVRENIAQIKADPWDIIKTCIPSYRSDDFDPAAEWNPGKIQLGCSPYVSAVYGKFGIDLAANAKKWHQAMTPTDLLHSGFFDPLYITT